MNLILKKVLMAMLFNSLVIVSFTYMSDAEASSIERDLEISFGDEGNNRFIVGAVKNTSVNSYPCVHLKFFLLDGNRKSDFVSAYVQNIQPGSEVRFKKKLPYVASFGLESTTVCQKKSPGNSDGKKKRKRLKIINFSASPTMAEAGKEITFSWKVKGAKTVRFYENNEELEGRTQLRDGTYGWPLTMPGAFSFSQDKTTTYKLVAEGRSGESVIKELTVRMKTPTAPGKPVDKSSSPKIKSFWITPEEPKPGEWITFHWDVANADSIKLYDDIGEIDLRSSHKRNSGKDSSVSTTIDKTTTFLLVAKNRNQTTDRKKFTVRVRGGNKPTGTCEISGKLAGKWRQQIREKATGPSSTWTVEVYVYNDNSSQPDARATVSNNGTYRFRGLVANQNYRVKPGWASSPGQGRVACRAGKKHNGPKFRITGSPRLD